MKKLLLFAVAIIGFSAVSFAQPLSASATASATIVAAISIDHSGTDMNFGKIIPITAGTIILDFNGTPAVGVAGPLIAGGTTTAAIFTITGSIGSKYIINLPNSGPYVVTGPGSKTMDITNFTSSLGNSGTLTTTTQELRVGATLHVGAVADQPAGEYTNSTGFNVTLAYE